MRENFTHEVRSVYYKSKKVSKGIYGTTTKKNLNKLKEECVKIELIP